MCRIRFFFDAGSGVCFWAGNDFAREKYGYPIDANQLPLSQHLCSDAEALIKLFDTNIDWGNPSGKSPWSSEESEVFKQRVKSFFAKVQNELGSGFELVDESELGVAV